MRFPFHASAAHTTEICLHCNVYLTDEKNKMVRSQFNQSSLYGIVLYTHINTENGLKCTTRITNNIIEQTVEAGEQKRFNLLDHLLLIKCNLYAVHVLLVTTPMRSLLIPANFVSTNCSSNYSWFLPPSESICKPQQTLGKWEKNTVEWHTAKKKMLSGGKKDEHND